jgi:hypothetical protein
LAGEATSSNFEPVEIAICAGRCLPTSTETYLLVGGVKHPPVHMLFVLASGYVTCQHVLMISVLDANAARQHKSFLCSRVLMPPASKQFFFISLKFTIFVHYL